MSPRSIICVGTSLTMGIPHPELDKWPTRLALLLEDWKPGAFRVFNRGWNGANTAAALERIDSEVRYLLPALVVVEMGVNDALVRPFRRSPQVGLAEFRANLEEIHRYIVDHDSEALFLAQHVPEPDSRPLPEDKRYVPGNGKSFAENYLPYYHAVIELAAKLKVPLADVPKTLAKENLRTADIVEPDGVHLFSLGNAIYAQAVFQCLQSSIG